MKNLLLKSIKNSANCANFAANKFFIVRDTYKTYSLVPSLPHVLYVARRERREPGKIYHVRDVGVEATWSAARADHDSALLMEP